MSMSLIRDHTHPLINNDGVKRSKCIPYWITTPNLKVVKFSLTVALNDTKVAVRSIVAGTVVISCEIVINTNFKTQKKVMLYRS